MELGTNLALFKCKINFITKNNAVIPLRNHSMMQGAIYDMYAQVDPVFSYKYHNLALVKPWSFSLLKFNQIPVETKRKGFSKIKEGKRGYFFLKTIDPKVHKLIIQFGIKGKILHIGRLNLIIEEIVPNHHNLNKLPENIGMLTIRLETPTFFYNHSSNLQEKLSAETFLNFQCEKFKQLGIMNIEPKQLYPYLRISGDYTKESWGYITNRKDINQAIGFKGIVGIINFKIYGNSFEKELIWKILHISQFTGIGTRTSMGFGHNSIIP